MLVGWWLGEFLVYSRWLRYVSQGLFYEEIVDCFDVADILVEVADKDVKVADILLKWQIKRKSGR
ncbi:hypothetical protein KW850_08035 [Bacillus sp. sid0103]|uniref:hypothetical protein n=1 Tax=Bacillus sp. sid0103 TaxID=2856337 RepID=UPI001C49131C|nr:hypothetical protein [Bacillus sp. sid0103]MBV7505203.1 hypothetical protein [Bacillus sp. sid0103]